MNDRRAKIALFTRGSARTPLRTSLAAAGSAALLLIALPALAQNEQAPPTRDQCLAAHHSAQELKRKGALLEAQAELSICSSAGCPGAIISDCGQWIADLEQTTPSMVFEVRLDGRQVGEFQIEVDGVRVSELAKAFKVNPGRHVVRAELPNAAPQEETVVLPEGQRMRLVSFEFKSTEAASSGAAKPANAASSAPPPVAPAETTRPTPVLVYPLLGVAAAGFATFGVFSYLGHSKQSDLESSCSPDCSKDDLAPMKRNYLIGDISAGVGAAALLTSAIVYFTRPTHTTTGGLSVRVASAAPRDPGSLSISLNGSF